MSYQKGQEIQSSEGNSNMTIPEFLEIPVDKNDPRFTQSFDPSMPPDLPSAKAFCEEYGFCIFRNVLHEAECQEQIEDMLMLLQEKDPDVDPSQPETWSKALAPFGMPKGSGGLFRPSLLRLRQDPRLYTVFSALLGTKDLVVNHDRWLLQRPPPAPLTRRNVHLDMNPWQYADENAREEILKRVSALDYRSSRAWIKENNDVHRSFGPSLQAILNLRDITDRCHGGTILIPGSHKVFNAWLEECADVKQKTDGAMQYMLDDNDPRQALVQHPTLRAGSLIVWDQRVFHGSMPNTGGGVRAAIPMKAFSASILRESPHRAQQRAGAIEKEIEKAGFQEELTQVGQQVFGLNLNRQSRKQGKKNKHQK